MIDEQRFVPRGGGEGSDARDPLQTFDSVAATPHPPQKGPPASDLHLSRWAVEVQEMETTELLRATELRGTDSAELVPPAYRLHRIVGRGGNGEVWEATQTSLARTIAVKRLRDHRYIRDREDAASNQRLLEYGFRQEALTTGALEHPNIVPVYDFGVDEGGRPLLAMKLIKGSPWDDLIREDFAKLSEEEFLAKHLPILIDVAQAVAFAHSRGIVHRDIKPSQVMLGEFGEVILTDWGLALVYDENVVPVSPSTETPGLAGSIIAPTTATASNPAGTPAFMAPEQTETNASNIGPWTDVFLLGATLYLLLTGTNIHNAATLTGVLEQASRGEVQPPGSRNPDREMPPDLVELASSCLRRDRDQRPPSAKAFIQAVQDHLSGSGKRRESLAITQEVARRVDAADGSYRELAECLISLNRATTLWASNAQAPGLRERVLRDYATAALGNHDLRLASVQADAMEPGPERLNFQARIREEELRIARHAKQRRALMYATAVLLVVVSLVGVQERQQATKARREQGFAEELMDYMLKDLRDRLKPINRLDLLESVAKKSLQYFEARGTADEGLLSARQRGQALENVGRVFLEQGHLEDAIASYQASLGIREKNAQAHPRDRDARLELMRGYNWLSYSLLEHGEVEKAMGMVKKADEWFPGLMSEFPNDPAISREWAVRESREGLIERTRGNLDRSSELLGKSVEIRERLAAGGVDKARLSEFSNALLDYSVSRQMLGDLEGAIKAQVRSLEIKSSLVALDPSDATMELDLCTNQVHRGELEYSSGDIPAAIKSFLAGMEIADKLAAADPANAIWQEWRATCRLNLCESLLDSGQLGEGIAHLRKGRELLEPLRRRTPGNNTYRLLMGLFEYQAGRAAVSGGDKSGGMKEWEGAFATLQPLTVGANRDPAAVDYASRALFMLGRDAEATSLAQGLLARGWLEPGFRKLCAEHKLVAPPVAKKGS